MRTDPEKIVDYINAIVREAYLLGKDAGEHRKAHPFTLHQCIENLLFILQLHFRCVVTEIPTEEIKEGIE